MAFIVVLVLLPVPGRKKTAGLWARRFGDSVCAVCLLG
jgi:hypothetical protein